MAKICGRGGIRTHEELAPSLVFKTSALDHYATLPTPAFAIYFADCVRRSPLRRAMAESVGVEPTRDYSSRRFSKPVHYRSAHSPGVTNYTRKGRLVSTLDDQGFPIVKCNFCYVADKFIADTASFTTTDCQVINFILKFR